MAIPVVTIIGKSGSGKTTLMEKLIFEMKGRGSFDLENGFENIQGSVDGRTNQLKGKGSFEVKGSV